MLARIFAIQAGGSPCVAPHCSCTIFTTSLRVTNTSFVGEAKIGAWELASGCGHYYAAWVLNLGAVAIGLLLAPRQVGRAFLRGWRCTNLNHLGVDAGWPEETVGGLRRRLGLAL